VKLLGPASGDQACGEIGSGRLLEPTQIRDALAAHFGDGPLAGMNVTVTAGPTREPIDPVRVLTNRSSGKMGYAVAAALAAAGAKVTLISGPTALPSPAGVTRVEVETADEMLKASLTAAKKAKIFIGTAAVADYRAAQNAKQKIKKKSDTLALHLTKTTDILSAVRARHPKLFMVGFAAETEKLAQHAREKLAKKKLDLVAANLVGNGRAFDRDDNELQLFWNDGTKKLRKAPKTELARELVRVLIERLSLPSVA
jgi:phosphopantothenoylcysteine decarboxylase/phosphopantothenate--cysteine ligase